MSATSEESVRQDYGPWFNYVVRRDSPRLRLLCLSGAGTGPSEFVDWRLAVPGDVEVWPVQLPGRERRLREAPWTDLADIVSELRSALVAAEGGTCVPLVLFGHSFGALVMYELCGRLSAQGREIAGLVVSGLAAPDRPGRRASVADYSDADLLDWIRRLGGTPTELLESARFTDWLLRDLRAAYRIREEYQVPSEALSQPLIVFGGTEDFETTVDDLDAWSRFTSSRFRRHLLPGGHFFLREQRERFLEILAGELTELSAGLER